MAAAEARAAWQRTANRCFMQEDAKRAPKLACCPSSSLSKLQSGSSAGDAANVPNHPGATFTPLNWNPTNSNLPPDTKWWLRLQPNSAYQKDFTCEQLNALAELEGMRNGNSTPTYKCGEGTLSSEDDHYNLHKRSLSTSVTFIKHDSEARVHELKAVNCNPTPLFQPKSDISEQWYQDEKIMDWESIDMTLNQPKKACLDMEAPQMGSDMIEPWWRTADKDELASLVVQKSLEHVENCDLPRPLVKNFCGSPFDCFASLNHLGTFSSYLDQKKTSYLSNPVDHLQSSLGSTDGKHSVSSETHHSFHDSAKLCSGISTSSTTITDPTESRHICESDPSKAQLLEALCHSQTRAREAENAARQACIEKEHIIKLFFKQASHLFAYKQWLHMLQLESFLLQLRSEDCPISMLLPMKATRQLRKGLHKVTRRKRRGKKYDISSYAVVFAVGLGLVGAGLLLGWTLGWLLPSF